MLVVVVAIKLLSKFNIICLPLRNVSFTHTYTIKYTPTRAYI